LVGYKTKRIQINWKTSWDYSILKEIHKEKILSNTKSMKNIVKYRKFIN
jgi:hypothetical protein